MASTSKIAYEMKISQDIVDIVAGEIGVRGENTNAIFNGYKIKDDDILKLRKAVWSFLQNEVKEYISEFGANSPQTQDLAKEYKMEHLLSDNELEIHIEKLKSENSSLLSKLSKSEEIIEELQVKLNIMESDKKEN